MSKIRGHGSEKIRLRYSKFATVPALHNPAKPIAQRGPEITFYIFINYWIIVF